jgi:two-component system OmpR family response regulator
MGRGKLLHVEDDAQMRTFVALALEGAGYTVETCGDGLEALEVLQRAPQDHELIVLDLVLPWLNGLEVLAAIRAEPALRTRPILVTTGTMVSPNEFGGDPHLSVLAKPFTEQQLLVAVESLLLSRVRISAQTWGARTPAAAPDPTRDH